MRGIDQLTGGGQYPHENCQEACTASVLYDAGKADTIAHIESFDFGDGDNPADGTGAKVIVDRLDRSGIASHVDDRPFYQVISEARLRGLDRVFVPIWSDHQGRPSPGSGLGHWILWGGATSYMQPVGGGINIYSDAQIAACAQTGCVVVDKPIDQRPGGDDLISLDGSRALIWMFRLQLFGPAALGEKDAQTAIDSYAAKIANGENVEGVLNQMLTDAQRDDRLRPEYKL